MASYLELNEQHKALRTMVRDFATREIAPGAGKRDELEEFPYAIVKKLGEMGLLGLTFPEEYGGKEADTLSFVVTVEELARADCSVALTLIVNLSLGGNPICRFGTEQQKKTWLVPLARGEMLGAIGLTEPGGGSDTASARTTAILKENEWLINGGKVFITSAGTDMTGFVTITAVTGHRKDGKNEISSFIVPKEAPGYTMSKPLRKLGFRSSDTRELYFSDCRVSQENLLGEKGTGLRQILTCMDDGRIGIAALAIGMIQGCLDLSFSYAKERLQFGKPIFDFQTIQFKLSDIALNLELARLICYKAAILKDRGDSYTKEAAMAKLFASEAAVRAAEDSVQIHGGIGYMEERPLARFYRDAKMLTIGEGTSEIQRMVISRYIGSSLP